HGDHRNAFRRSVPHHAGVQLPGSAGAGSDEAPGRFTHSGKRDRIDDGSIGHAPTAGFFSSNESINPSRFSHGPVDRLPDVKNSAYGDRSQAGGYKISKWFYE